MSDVATSNIMYSLTKWEGWMRKYLAQGHGVWTKRSKVRVPYSEDYNLSILKQARIVCICNYHLLINNSVSL